MIINKMGYCRNCANMKPEPKETPFGTYPLTCRIYKIGIREDSQSCIGYYIPVNKLEDQPDRFNIESDRESNRLE